MHPTVKLKVQERILNYFKCTKNNLSWKREVNISTNYEIQKQSTKGFTNICWMPSVMNIVTFNTLLVTMD